MMWRVGRTEIVSISQENTGYRHCRRKKIHVVTSTSVTVGHVKEKEETMTMMMIESRRDFKKPVILCRSVIVYNTWFM